MNDTFTHAEHISDEVFLKGLELRFPTSPWCYERAEFSGTKTSKIPAIEAWLGYPLSDQEREQVNNGLQLWQKAVPIKYPDA